MGEMESYKPHKGARGYEVKVGAKAVAQHCLKVDSAFIAAANPPAVLALLDELEAAEKHIAELEAREVNLPQRQEPTSSGHYGEGYLVPSDTGSALDYEETVDALVAAGIITKVER